MFTKKEIGHRKLGSHTKNCLVMRLYYKFISKTVLTLGSMALIMLYDKLCYYGASYNEYFLMY